MCSYEKAGKPGYRDLCFYDRDLGNWDENFAMYHNLRNWCWIQQMKSGSRTIYVKLILSFFVYRCHGNIDFIEK